MKTVVVAVGGFILAFSMLTNAVEAVNLRGDGEKESRPQRRRLTHHNSLDPKTVQIKADFQAETERGSDGMIPMGGFEQIQAGEEQQQISPSEFGADGAAAGNSHSAPTGTSDGAKSRRRFLNYQSSTWELSWLNRVDEWATKKQICQILIHDHSQFVHDFLNITCTSRYHPPYDNWCVIDDDYHPLWYNSANRGKFELSWMNPLPYDARIDPPQPVVPGKEHEHIVSKFTFLDEFSGEQYVEYIEPLVSHLRFPLAQCIKNYPNEDEFQYHMLGFRGFVIPPPPTLIKDKAVYFDAGGAQWGHGPGGPQLQYFFNIWKRHGIEFDEIHAYQIHTPIAKFMESVPEEVKDRIDVQKVELAVSADQDSEEHPFLPALIKRTTSPEDYVLFKLDVDNSQIEGGSVLALLQDEGAVVNELVWEHHIRGNYLMKQWGLPDELPDVSLRESYELFLQLRLKGIRAHSWI